MIEKVLIEKGMIVKAKALALVMVMVMTAPSIPPAQY